MQLEFKTEVVELNDQLAARLEQLRQEGWLVMPGVAPIAVYHLCRPQSAPGQAVGGLKIDEAGIQIIRDGKIVNGV